MKIEYAGSFCSAPDRKSKVGMKGAGGLDESLTGELVLALAVQASNLRLCSTWPLISPGAALFCCLFCTLTLN